MKVGVERANRFYYPDILVCCNPLEADADDYFETAPKLIIEVPSPKTAATDDGEKRINYQTLASLAEYLLLDPKTHEAILYRRNSFFWPHYFWVRRMSWSCCRLNFLAVWPYSWDLFFTSL